MTQPPSDKIFKVTETGNLRLLIDPFSVMTADGSSFVYGGGFVDATNNSSGFVVVDSATGAASVTTNGSDTEKYYLAYVQASQGTARIVQQFENGPYKQNAADGGGTVTTVSVATANGFSGTVANATTTPAITIVAGAITPISAAFSGTAGNGFVSLLTQSSSPAAPASGFALFADSTGRLSWRSASDGFTRSFDVTATANRTFTIPDADLTFAGQNYANNFTAAQTITGTTSTDGPTLGAEFLGASGWTSTDWTGSFAAGWAHTPGNTTALTQSTAAVSATKYQITYTVTGRTAGTFDISFGGVSNTGLSATGSWGPTTTSTASLSVTPTSTFDGTIVLSIKAITAASSPVLTLKSSAGTVVDEVRSSSSTGNTLRGVGTGRYITTGTANAGFGYQSLYSNTTGSNNSGIGVYSLYSNTIGTHNSGLGVYSLYSNTTGSFNSGFGYQSLYSNTTGSNNSGVGALAGRYIASGAANSTGSSSVFIGYDTRASADGEANQIVIGASAIGAGANTATLGNTSITKTVLRGAVNIGTGPAILGSTVAANLRLGDADAAAPVAQKLSRQSAVAGTSNTAGALFTDTASLGTGLGDPGSTGRQTGIRGVTGTVQHTAGWRDFIAGKDTTLTEATATTLFTVTVGTGKYLGMIVECTVFASDGTDFQVLHSTLRINTGNKAGTLGTTGIMQTDCATPYNSAGTLTPVTYTLVDNGSGVLAVKCAATSSLVQTTLSCKYQITAINSSDAITITPA